MYLGKPLQYYQSSNLPQRAQMFDFDLKSCFVFSQHFQSLCLLTCLCLTLIALDLDSLCSLSTCFRLSCFGLLNTSSRSASCGLFSTVSTFLALCLNTSTRSACCSVVSGGYLNTLTFVGPVLVSFYPLPVEFPSAHV